MATTIPEELKNLPFDELRKRQSAATRELEEARQKVDQLGVALFEHEVKLLFERIPQAETVYLSLESEYDDNGGTFNFVSVSVDMTDAAVEALLADSTGEEPDDDTLREQVDEFVGEHWGASFIEDNFGWSVTIDRTGVTSN